MVVVALQVVVVELAAVPLAEEAHRLVPALLALVPDRTRGVGAIRAHGLRGRLLRRLLVHEAALRGVEVLHLGASSPIGHPWEGPGTLVAYCAPLRPPIPEELSRTNAVVLNALYHPETRVNTRNRVSTLGIAFQHSETHLNTRRRTPTLGNAL